MVKELLEWYKEFQEGHITSAELEKHCHYWTVKYALEELRYQPLPAEPYKITEWKHMSAKAREYAPLDVKEEMNKLMSGFNEHRNRIRWVNYAHLEWLKSMLKTFQKYQCEENILMVREKIGTHMGVKNNSVDEPATSVEVAL